MQTEFNQYEQQGQHEQLQVYNPEVIVLPTPEDVDQLGATHFIQQVEKKADSTLILPTGSTPIGMYRLLGETYQQGRLDLSRVTTLNLDEYYRLGKSHPQSYDAFMRSEFFNQVNIPEEQRHIPNSEALDPDEEAEGYEQLLRQAGQIDVAYLGLGPGLTCHIAFNGPGTPFNSRVHKVDLDEETIRANAKFFDSVDDVPRSAITQGIGNILEAKHIVLLAKGEGKAVGIQRTLEGPISEDAPASALRLHPNVTFIIDAAAASLLQNQP